MFYFDNKTNFLLCRIRKVAEKYQRPLTARGRRQKDSRSASKASSSNVQPETKVEESRDGSHTDLSESFEEDESPCDKHASSTLSCGSQGNCSRADVTKLPSIVE